MAPGFNPLEVPKGVEPFGQMLGLLGLFKKIWAEFWGPRMEEILRNSFLVLLRVVGKLLNPGVKGPTRPGLLADLLLDD